MNNSYKLFDRSNVAPRRNGLHTALDAWGKIRPFVALPSCFVYTCPDASVKHSAKTEKIVNEQSR